MARQPLWAQASSLLRFRDHTRKHHTRQHSTGGVIGPSQRPVTYKTKHSQKTDIGGIQTRNSRKRVAADPRLRPRATGIGFPRMRTKQILPISLPKRITNSVLTNVQVFSSGTDFYRHSPGNLYDKTLNLAQEKRSRLRFQC